MIALLISAAAGELIVRCCATVRNVGPSFTAYHPLYGKALKKNFSCRRIAPEFTMQFTTNADGFRGRDTGPAPRRSILFLGDSFTMGYGVNDGEEFPALVRKSLRRTGGNAVNVINAGMGDNGNGRWVKFLRTEAARFSPQLVVFQIHENDFRDNVREQLFHITPSGDLRERAVPPPGARWMIQGIVEAVPGLAYSYLLGFARQLFWDRRGHGPVAGAGDDDRRMLEDQLLISIVGEALSICKKQQWNTMAVLVGNSGNRMTMVKEFFSVRNIPVIVIPGKSERPDLYYRVDGHWNAPGHRLAAERILNRLKSDGGAVPPDG